MAEAEEPTPEQPASSPDVPLERDRLRYVKAPFRYATAAYRRTSLRMLIFRVAVYGTCAFALFLVVAYTAIRLLVKPEDLRAFIKQTVEEQTGGRLDIGTLDFNVLTGISLKSVQFYPPAPADMRGHLVGPPPLGDTRGYLYGGEVTAIPLANFEAMNLSYSIPKLLALKVHLKAAQLVGPEFHLRIVDGISNISGIMAYRSVKFPSEPEPEVEVVEEKSSGDSLLPFSPALLYMPIEILTQNIGITNLRMDMIKEEKGRIAQTLVTNGLSLDMGVHWWKRDSSMWFGMTSPFERPLELEIQDGVRDAGGQLTGDLTQTVLVRTALNMRCALEDFNTISVDFATRILEVKTPVAGYQDLGTYTKVRIKINEDYKGLVIETLESELADALAYELKGDVTLPAGNFESIDLRLKQKFNLNLQNAAALAKPFVSDLKASGSISFDDFKIEGLIEPAKFADLGHEGKVVPLPYVSGVLWLEDVFADYPGVGLSMDPLSGNVSIAAGPSLAGAGSQVDLAVDMDIPRVEITQTVPVGAKSTTITAGVEQMVSKVTARVLWPEMIAPVFKVNVEAQHVKASGQGIAPLDAPLYVDIDADGRGDLSRVAFSANIELTDLLEFTAMADCQAKCTKFRSSANSRMESLERLHSVALPLGGVLGLTEFMPTKLSGTVDFQFSARGKLPDPLTTPVPHLVRDADLRFNTQISLAKFNAKVPFFNVDLKAFENRVLANGSLKEQHVELAQKFDSLSLELPPKPDPVTGAPAPGAKSMPIAVNRYSLDVVVNNQIDGPLDLANPLPQLITDVETWLYIGKVNVDGVLPRPISEIQVDTVLHQAHLSEIKVKSVDVRLPDYGTTVKVLAEAIVGPDFMPKMFKTTVETHVAHAGDERLPGNIKTSGRIDAKVSVDTPDMRKVTLDGATNFEKFNVTIPAPEGQEGNLLVVEEVDGQVPFKQTIYLPPLDTLLKPALALDPTAAAAAAAAAAPATASAAASAEPVAITEDKPVPNLADTQGDDQALAADKALDQAMNKYFEKTEDKLLANTNVVALVDYGSIRPFYPGRKPLGIKRIEAANLELSKMEFDVELRQNWFAVNQFVIGFLGGKIQGDFQLAFDDSAKTPSEIPRTLRTSVHMTRLDTRKLIERFPNLQGKGSSWTGFSNPYLDGTVHLTMDLQTSELGGGIEMTSIGKEQLRMMLYYVDPFEQNPTISDIRKALAFGDVRQVSIPLKNGEIGMDVDVRVLGAPLPTPKLSRFPISQVIQNVKDQMLEGQSEEKDPDAAPAAVPTSAPVEPQPVVPSEPQVSG